MAEAVSEDGPCAGDASLARVAAVAADLDRVLAGLVAAGRGAGDLPVSVRRELLGRVDRAAAVLATVRADLLVAERASGAWRGAGDRSFAAWAGRATGEGARGGAAQERRADALVALPALREATTAGQATLAHVDTIARTAATGSPAVQARLATPEGQAQVLDLATRLDATRFSTALAQWAATIDHTALERTHQAQHAARYLHITDTSDGTRITARLDHMTGHRVRLALEALTPRPAADEDRTSDQRRADALDTMAQTILALPTTTPGAAQRPHICLLLTEDTWTQIRTHHTGPAGPTAGGTGTTGVRETGPGEARTPPPMAPVTLEDGTPVPLSEVAQALCDCEITRIVLDAHSQPIDLGRTTRRYTGEQRRAILARDGGCAWTDCTMAPRWTQIHHIAWWDRDTGPTSLANGIALCNYHHHETHRQNLTITRHTTAPGEIPPGERRTTYTFTTPTGEVLGAPARPPARPPHDSPPAPLPRPSRTASPGTPPRTGRESTSAPPGEQGTLLAG